ncbi:hypothetical protein ScalyP_jg10643 [Parmales sp. scaly parma]|nr:hypothetical protein ScalyP_jg10643 [Parmales sp. scaly parma]
MQIHALCLLAFLPLASTFTFVKHHPQASFTITSATVLNNNVADVTDAELEVVLETCDGPVIIDAYATWCGPCQILKPELEKAMESLGKRGVKAYSFDTDKYEEMAGRLRVMGLPTLYFFKENGVLLRRMEGAYNEAELIEASNEIFFGEEREVCEKDKDKVDATDELAI